jgi:hypothetical protein
MAKYVSCMQSLGYRVRTREGEGGRTSMAPS